ncbi:hypothetical protein F0254_17010 [Vibrio alginolyticus]|uniref:Uncharacterized protein n=1 Tax=Vibrio alginolyticus TaxID=663 RepID=A0A7Y4B4H4_VIBAL|nr:hypothetical protein [Vibrio alginolyticus]
MFFGHLFFGAENSDSCLNQQFDLEFLSFSGRISKLDFQNYESFRFSTFWLWFVNQSRVNFVSNKA